MNVFDSSALLAFLQGEEGGDLVEAQLLTDDSCCSAANWSEVAQKVRSGGHDWSIARALLLSYDLAVEPVTAQDAERAAERWERGAGLSLGDRLCLALTDHLGATAWTADALWGQSPQVRQIR